MQDEGLDLGAGFEDLDGFGKVITLEGDQIGPPDDPKVDEQLVEFRSIRIPKEGKLVIGLLHYYLMK